MATIEQWYKDYKSSGWGDPNYSLEEYKADVRRRLCILSGRLISIDELDDEISKISDLNGLLR